MRSSTTTASEEAGDRPGRLRDRRQGRDGLGHRRRARAGATCRARPSSPPRSRSQFPGGAILTFQPARRTTAAGTATTIRTTTWGDSGCRSRLRPMPRPTRCPADVRKMLAIPARQADAGPERRRLQLLAHDGARMERRQRLDRRRSGEQHPEGSSQLVLREREKRASRPMSSSAAISSSRSKPVDTGRAGVSQPAASRAHRRRG